METLPLVMMLASQGVVTAITAYFFIKVLKTPPPRPEDETDEVMGEMTGTH